MKIPFSLETRNRLIHAVEHMLHIFGWPLLVGGGIAFLASLGFFFGEKSVNYWFFSILAMLVGFLLLHISWNLRRNFRRFFPD